MAEADDDPLRPRLHVGIPVARAAAGVDQRAAFNLRRVAPDLRAALVEAATALGEPVRVAEAVPYPGLGGGKRQGAPGTAAADHQRHLDAPRRQALLDGGDALFELIEPLGD